MALLEQTIEKAEEMLPGIAAELEKNERYKTSDTYFIYQINTIEFIETKHYKAVVAKIDERSILNFDHPCKLGWKSWIRVYFTEKQEEKAEINSTETGTMFQISPCKMSEFERKPVPNGIITKKIGDDVIEVILGEWGYEIGPHCKIDLNAEPVYMLKAGEYELIEEDKIRYILL